MGVLIRGMEMPRYCDECKMLYDCADCMVLGKTIDWETSHERRRDDCPLVEVPVPHGDLIERDALKTEVYTMTEWNGDVHRVVYEASVDKAPTVIEAEEKDDG